MAESRSSSAGASAGMPLRKPRGSADVEAAFAQLRDLVTASSRSHREIAADAALNPAALTKLLKPAQYPSRRDWSQVQAILVAAGADIDGYARAHGHLWGLEPTPKPSAWPPTSREPATDLLVDGPLLDETETHIEWLGDDAPTMPVSIPPAPRDDSPTVTRGADVAFPRVPPPLPLSVPPPEPPHMPSWVPAPSTFLARSRRRGRLPAPRSRVVAALAVVLVAVGAVVAALRGVGASEPGPGAVSAQQAPATAPQLPGPELAAPSTPPALLSRPEVVTTVAVGPIAGFAAASPDGRTVYVAHRARGVVSEIDTATNQVRISYPVPVGPPQSLAVSPDGSRLYVSVFGQPTPVAPSALAVLDARTRQQITAIPFATRPFVSALAPGASPVWRTAS